MIIIESKRKKPETILKKYPEVIVVEEKHSKIAKWTLVGSIVVASLVLLGVLAFIGYRIYMLTL